MGHSALGGALSLLPWRALAGLLLAGLLTLGHFPQGDMAEGAPLRRLGQNPRGLALGGTGVSYADDEMALYYNPAGLGSIQNFWVELLPIAVEASGDAVDLVTSGNFGTFDDPATLVRENIGKEIQLRGFFYPHAVINISPGFSVGFSYFYELQTEMMIRNQATPEIEAYYNFDRGQVVGLSWPMRDGQMLGGISMRTISRSSGAGTINSAALAVASANGTLDLEQELNVAEGSGTAYDVGMIWRMESLASMRGQFAAVLQNAGGTDLGLAGEIPQELSIGWSFRPKAGVPMLVALEFRDITKELTDDDSWEKRSHLGLEIGLLNLDKSTNMLALRAGYSAGAPSVGIEFSLWHSFSVQYVVYYQEYGDVAGEDSRKRQLLQLNVIGF